jgi:hypothetical protein
MRTSLMQTGWRLTCSPMMPYHVYVRPFAQNSATTADWSDEGRVTIGILPDDTLLEIFDFYLGETRLTNS